MSLTQRITIPRVAAGDPVTAEHYNMLVDSINRLLSGIYDDPSDYRNDFMVGELNEDLEGFERDKTAKRLWFDKSVAAGSDAWKDTGNTDPRIMELEDGLALQGERHLMLWLGETNRRLIIPTGSFHIGKLDAQLNEGSSATCSVWEDSGGSWVDSTKNVTVHDWLLATGDNIASGKKVTFSLHRQSRQYVVTGAECA